MKNILYLFCSYVDRIVNWSGNMVSWLTSILVVLICSDVVLRYLFSSTKTWILELEWHLFAIIFLLGAAFTFLHDKHVRVDLFYERFNPKKKKVIDAVGILFLLLPWCLVVMHASWDYTMNSFSFRESSPQPNGLPARYIIKGFIFLGFLLLFLQGLSLLIQSLIIKDNET